MIRDLLAEDAVGKQGNLLDGAEICSHESARRAASQTGAAEEGMNTMNTMQSGATSEMIVTTAHHGTPSYPVEITAGNFGAVASPSEGDPLVLANLSAIAAVCGGEDPADHPLVLGGDRAQSAGSHVSDFSPLSLSPG